MCALGAAAEPTVVPHGRLETLSGYKVVSVEGTPEEMGTAYGKLLGPTIRRVVKAIITDGFGKEADAYQNVLKGSKVMERFQPPEFLAELKAVAAAAKVSYDDLVLLQYFGDVRRCITGPGSASMCCSSWGRIKAARDLALGGRGRLDFSWNLGGAEGVPIVSISLHAVTIDATNLRLKVAMGKTPACQLPPKAFRLANRGLEALAE
jgi:hypothetical protein